MVGVDEGTGDTMSVLSIVDAVPETGKQRKGIGGAADPRGVCTPLGEEVGGARNLALMGESPIILQQGGRW